MNDRSQPIRTALETNDQSPKANLGQSLILAQLSLALRPWSFVLGLLAVALFLAACSGVTPGQTTVQGDQSGGGLLPEAVAQSFFEDLRSALQDREITKDDRRGVWVERLAGYFAPNERDDQRIALRTALDSFVTGRGDLEPNETLTLEVRFDNVEKVSESSNRAMVRLVNGSIYVLITRTTDKGVVTLYQDDVGLDRIFGSPDGSIPVIRIGRTWYLTES
jgi:hypothetical protein